MATSEPKPEPKLSRKALKHIKGPEKSDVDTSSKFRLSLSHATREPEAKTHGFAGLAHISPRKAFRRAHLCLRTPTAEAVNPGEKLEEPGKDSS